jgi:hypothetical protein
LGEHSKGLITRKLRKTTEASSGVLSQLAVSEEKADNGNDRYQGSKEKYHHALLVTQFGKKQVLAAGKCENTNQKNKKVSHFHFAGNTGRQRQQVTQIYQPQRVASGNLGGGPAIVVESLLLIGD